MFKLKQLKTKLKQYLSKINTIMDALNSDFVLNLYYLQATVETINLFKIKMFVLAFPQQQKKVEKSVAIWHLFESIVIK